MRGLPPAGPTRRAKKGFWTSHAPVLFAGRRASSPEPVNSTRPARKRGGVLGSLGRHMRDALMQAFPLEMRTESGLRVLLRTRSDLSVYHNIFVERTYPFARFAGELRTTQAPVVFDVGANTGMFAAAVFDHWSKAQVHSFEPQRKLVPRIREFAEINGLADRVTVNWCAISDRPGVARLYQNRNPISASLIREKAARRTIRRVHEVPILSLDEYAGSRNIQHVDILKLDVEGVELEAIRGAQTVLAGVRLLFLEVHPPFSTFSRAADMLKAAGLQCVNPVPPPDDNAQANCVFARRS